MEKFRVHLLVVILSTEYNHPPIKTTEGQFMSSNLIKFFFCTPRYQPAYPKIYSFKSPFYSPNTGNLQTNKTIITGNNQVLVPHMPFYRMRCSWQYKYSHRENHLKPTSHNSWCWINVGWLFSKNDQQIHNRSISFSMTASKQPLCWKLWMTLINNKLNTDGKS